MIAASSGGRMVRPMPVDAIATLAAPMLAGCDQWQVGAMRLSLAAWAAVHPGTLPNNDRELKALAGYRCGVAWERDRDVILDGWRLGDDGRYHREDLDAALLTTPPSVATITNRDQALSINDRKGRKSEAIRLRGEGLSIGEIAARTGVDRSTAHRWLSGDDLPGGDGGVAKSVAKRVAKTAADVAGDVANATGDVAGDVANATGDVANATGDVANATVLQHGEGGDKGGDGGSFSNNLNGLLGINLDNKLSPVMSLKDEESTRERAREADATSLATPVATANATANATPIATTPPISAGATKVADADELAAARALIAAFEKATLATRADAIVMPGSGDLGIALAMVRAGVTPDLVEHVTKVRQERLKRENKAALRCLKAIELSVKDALADQHNAAIRLNGAGSRGHQDGKKYWRDEIAELVKAGGPRPTDRIKGNEYDRQLAALVAEQ